MCEGPRGLEAARQMGRESVTGLGFEVGNRSLAGDRWLLPGVRADDARAVRLALSGDRSLHGGEFVLHRRGEASTFSEHKLSCVGVVAGKLSRPVVGLV